MLLGELEQMVVRLVNVLEVKVELQKVLYGDMNRKIKNATVTSYNDVVFKSKLEASVYKHLLQAGFDPVYEGMKFTIWSGFKPTVPFYTRIGRSNGLNMKKTIDITYTPDFTFMYNGKLIIIEVKGLQNDVFPYKFKMFRGMLEKEPYVGNTLLFEIFSIKQLKECIEIIKSYDSSTETK